MANTKITSRVIADDAVTTAAIADDAVTSAKLDTNIAIGGTLDVSGAFTSLGIDDNANATAITIDSSERVGIGTTSPSSPLEVVSGASHGTGFTQTRSGHPSFSLLSGGTNSVYLGIAPDGGSYNTFMQVVEDGTDINYVRFNTGAGSERMRIDSSGNVGIGTSSPSTKLDVIGTTNQGATIYATQLGVTESLFLQQSRGTFASKSNSGITDGVAIIGETYNSGSFQRQAEILFRNDGSTAGNGRLEFLTTTSASSSEKMRITSAGHVLINTTTLQGVGGLSLQVGGNNVVIENNTTSSAGNGTEYQVFRRNSSQIGSITMNGTTAVQYNTSSDYRLKENVVTDWDATTRLKQLRPSRFNFITEPDRTVDGFLAHEVQDIVPEAISGVRDEMQEEEYEVTPAVLDEDENVVTEAVMGTREVPKYQGIDQSKLVPLLVKTIQELEARITTLENA